MAWPGSDMDDRKLAPSRSFLFPGLFCRRSIQKLAACFLYAFLLFYQAILLSRPARSHTLVLLHSCACKSSHWLQRFRVCSVQISYFTFGYGRITRKNLCDCNHLDSLGNCCSWPTFLRQIPQKSRLFMGWARDTIGSGILSRNSCLSIIITKSEKVFTFATAICMIIGAANGDLGRHTQVDPKTDMPITTHRTTILMEVRYWGNNKLIECCCWTWWFRLSMPHK